VTFIDGPTDATGLTERANIEDRLSELAGGRIWKTQVPDDVDLARETDGGVLPYIIMRFANPLSIAGGRSIASGEQQQPQQMTFTVSVIGGDADSVESTMAAVNRLLVDFHPSDSANKIRSRGGFAYPNGDTSSKPTRYQEAGFYRFTWNPAE
jgi:hypothetical protein